VLLKSTTLAGRDCILPVPEGPTVKTCCFLTAWTEVIGLVKTAAYCQNSSLLSKQQPTDKTAAYCQNNCLLSKQLPTDKTAAYCQNSSLLPKQLPTVKTSNSAADEGTIYTKNSYGHQKAYICIIGVINRLKPCVTYTYQSL
jgi:hypothetical protein